MKVLLVCQVPPHFEQYRNKSQQFPDFQAQAFWVRALRQLGHKVEIFKYSDSVIVPHWLASRVSIFAFNNFPKWFAKYRLVKNRWYRFFIDNWIRDRKLGNEIEKFKPQVILVAGGVSDLTGRSLKMAKKRGMKLVLLHGMNPNLGATWFENNNASLFDFIAVNDPTHVSIWEKLGAKKAASLPLSAIDPGVHKKMKLTEKEKKKYEADVCFVGTLLPERQRLVKKLLQSEIDVKAWGYIPKGNGLDKSLKSVYQGEAWGEKAVKIYCACKIAINPVHKSMKAGGNMRTFEIAGSGTMQITNRCQDQWYKDGEEVVVYKNDKELVREIKLFLSDDRKRNRIAKAAYERTHREHTYKKRFDRLLKMI